MLWRPVRGQRLGRAVAHTSRPHGGLSNSPTHTKGNLMSTYTITTPRPHLDEVILEAASAELDDEYGHLYLKDSKGENVAIFARGEFSGVIKSAKEAPKS